MIVHRCPDCGEETSRHNENDMTRYKEVFDKKPCSSCKLNPNTAEEKLLNAIFGGSRNT